MVEFEIQADLKNNFLLYLYIYTYKVLFSASDISTWTNLVVLWSFLEQIGWLRFLQ